MRCDHFELDLVNLGLEDRQQAFRPRAYQRNDLGVLLKSMKLVTHLLAQIEEVVRRCHMVLTTAQELISLYRPP